MTATNEYVLILAPRNVANDRTTLSNSICRDCIFHEIETRICTNTCINHESVFNCFEAEDLIVNGAGQVFALKNTLTNQIHYREDITLLVQAYTQRSNT